MTSEYIPRASLDSFQPGLVDAELKSLKLLSRRLQSSLTILGAELQLLRRFYYKNKNQHRGALFWRNVSELQRYLHKLENLNLQDSIITLRNAFYGPTARQVNDISSTTYLLTPYIFLKARAPWKERGRIVQVEDICPKSPNSTKSLLSYWIRLLTPRIHF